MIFSGKLPEGYQKLLNNLEKSSGMNSIEPDNRCKYIWEQIVLMVLGAGVMKSDQKSIPKMVRLTYTMSYLQVFISFVN